MATTLWNTYSITITFKKEPEQVSASTLEFYVRAANINSAWLKGVAKVYQLLSDSDGTISHILVGLVAEGE